MLLEPFHHCLVLTGPTGCGKTALGVQLAEALGAEIISMDSMALYRGMDIGTAKPSPEDRRRVCHHLVDVLEPWQSASVAWWLQQAAVCCREIESRGRRALFVGGTPLYLKALLHGLFNGPPADAAIRQHLAATAGREGRQALHERLARVDAATAARLHPHDLRRVIRALEVWELTGRPISSWQDQWQRQPTAIEAWWIDRPRSELYARIDRRVKVMIEAGLEEEVAGLRRLHQPLSPEASQALGYKEMIDYLDGRTSFEQTRTRIQTRSRQFAKRQLTWFRQMPQCRPLGRELTFQLWGLTID